MNQLAPLASGSVPAHIQQSKALNLNDNAAKNWSGGFSVLSIRGRTWRIGDVLLRSPPDTGPPVSELDIVVVGIASAVSKAYFPEAFVDGEAPKPTCMSIDGIAPDAAAPIKQHTSCKVCPHNAFGTALQGKGKACRDARRIAVVPAGDEQNEAYGGPMLLRLPPTSIPKLIKYTDHLKQMGADISQVVTTISFNFDVTHPEVTFKEADWLRDPEAYATVLDHAQSEFVNRMLNEEMAEVLDGSQPAQPAASPLQAAERPAHVAPVQIAAPTPAPVQAPAPTPAPVKRASPFAKTQAQAPAQAKTNGAAAPAPAQEAQAPAPAQETVVQGAPADMETIIDSIEDLLK